MQQDSRRPNEPAAAQVSLRTPFVSERSNPTPRPLPETRKAPRVAASDSLTAKLQDYRDWWNLPRTRSRKTHT